MTREKKKLTEIKKSVNKNYRPKSKKKKLTAPALPAWSPTAVLYWPYIA